MLQPGILIGGDWNHGMEKMTFQKQLGTKIPFDVHSFTFFRGVLYQPPTGDAIIIYVGWWLLYH
jgi:hypothetical protein